MIIRYAGFDLFRVLNPHGGNSEYCLEKSNEDPKSLNLCYLSSSGKTSYVNKYEIEKIKQFFAEETKSGQKWSYLEFRVDWIKRMIKEGKACGYCSLWL